MCWTSVTGCVSAGRLHKDVHLHAGNHIVPLQTVPLFQLVYGHAVLARDADDGFTTFHNMDSQVSTVFELFGHHIRPVGGLSP
jgi:hypothetical protein